MLASDRAVSEIALPAFEIRALIRRAALPALLACAAVAALLLARGSIHALAGDVRRGFGVSPGWAAIGAGFEFISLAGYVGLLALIAGRATPRVRARESAQITLAGAAATRLLPTAGAGGLALTLWALRRAGLQPRVATRTLLVFLVVLYSVFLGSIVVSGTVLALGLVGSRGPLALSAIPALAALLGILLCLALAFTPGRRVGAGRRRRVGQQRAPRRASKPACDRSAAPCATRAGWFDREIRGWRARSRTGCSTLRSCGRCCTRSAPRPQSRSSRSRTASGSSPTRCRSRARSAAGSPAC